MIEKISHMETEDKKIIIDLLDGDRDRVWLLSDTSRNRSGVSVLNRFKSDLILLRVHKGK